MSEASPSVFMKLIKQPLVPAKESKSMKRWAETKKKRVVEERDVARLSNDSLLNSLYLISYKAFNYSLSRSLCEHD